MEAKKPSLYQRTEAGIIRAIVALRRLATPNSLALAAYAEERLSRFHDEAAQRATASADGELWIVEGHVFKRTYDLMSYVHWGDAVMDLWCEMHEKIGADPELAEAKDALLTTGRAARQPNASGTQIVR